MFSSLIQCFIHKLDVVKLLMCNDYKMNSMTIRKNYFIIRFAKLKMLYYRVATRKMKKIFSIENGNIYGIFKQFVSQRKEEIYKNIVRTSCLFKHVSNWTLFIVAELSKQLHLTWSNLKLKGGKFLREVYYN